MGRLYHFIKYSILTVLNICCRRVQELLVVKSSLRSLRVFVYDKVRDMPSTLNIS